MKNNLFNLGILRILTLNTLNSIICALINLCRIHPSKESWSICNTHAFRNFLHLPIKWYCALNPRTKTVYFRNTLVKIYGFEFFILLCFNTAFYLAILIYAINLWNCRSNPTMFNHWRIWEWWANILFYKFDFFIHL